MDKSSADSHKWFQRFREHQCLWSYKDCGPHASYEMVSKHSDFYFNTDIAVGSPPFVDEICEEFVRICTARNLTPDWVISYSASVSSGLVLAEKLAALLKARFGLVDLKQSHCRFQPDAGQPILIVTDDIHTGGSIGKTITLISPYKAKIIPVILTLGNFSGQAKFQGMEIISLFEHKFGAWPQEDCPLCKQGSAALPARQQWQDLLANKV